MLPVPRAEHRSGCALLRRYPSLMATAKKQTARTTTTRSEKKAPAAKTPAKKRSSTSTRGTAQGGAARTLALDPVTLPVDAPHGHAIEPGWKGDVHTFVPDATPGFEGDKMRDSDWTDS